MAGADAGAFCWPVNVLEMDAIPKQPEQISELRLGKTLATEDDFAHGRKMVRPKCSSCQQIYKQRGH